MYKPARTADPDLDLQVDNLKRKTTAGAARIIMFSVLEDR